MAWIALNAAETLVSLRYGTISPRAMPDERPRHSKASICISTRITWEVDRGADPIDAVKCERV
jgi:hypothetical protein